MKKGKLWLPPKRRPSKIEKRRLLAAALEMLIISCLESHVYMFANDLRVQVGGGPIGLDLTGEIADTFMHLWDRMFLKKLKDLGISVLFYSRYKDDINLVVEALQKGTKYYDGKLIFDESLAAEERNLHIDQTTMNVLTEIANQIHKMLSFTNDVPSNHEDKKVPILDLKVSLNPSENNRLDFEFYEKKTKNPKVILASSAISWSKKRTILTQEGLRRLRNTAIPLGEEVQNGHLSNFMLKLKKSGYDKKFRIEILKSVKSAYKKMVEADEQGEIPLYRSSEWKKANPRKLRNKSRIDWWNKKGPIKYSTVLFVPPTPGSALCKKMQAVEKSINMNSSSRIKVVEKGGKKLKDILVQANPYKPNPCEKKICPVCHETKFTKPVEKDKINCNLNNVGYRWACITCKENGKIVTYEGETARSLRIRSIEHLKDLTKMKLTSPLVKHTRVMHPETNPNFQVKMTKKFSEALSRQANEAVRIKLAENSINSKSEFNHPPTDRVTVNPSSKSKSARSD